ncbi:uncharacterized protein LOC110092549 [Dendrobium catenatum]|uniref:Uncharacterized protein n=1 Tax=Dendrobium catenatum TaxID=906689 RepID=A0A2I0XI57_9ASPA|nr:uncharacterized protein LOC110092549 [Dendrobium catenatum]PKU87588.1 hypothetical protein MA16_Dca022869 [Dendrobium catenatum]
MGSCFSSSCSAASTTGRSPTAKVINADGLLIEYSQPVQVSHVLGLNHRAFFLSNADGLFYGHHIHALDDNRYIELGKLYFLLPAKRLNHPLTAAEMAALAVSANSALADAALMRKKKSNSRRRRKGVQVLPVVTALDSDGYESFNEISVGNWKTEKGWRKSDEVKQRALRGGESAVKRHFRPSLDSIEEVYE